MFIYACMRKERRLFDAFIKLVQIRPSLEVPCRTTCGYGGLSSDEALRQPAEMETLGGPHAVEQKQTNGLSS